MIPDTIVHRKAWMRFFVAAALFNYVIGLPIMLARTWSYNLTYVPSVTRDPMTLRLWADFGFAVLLIGWLPDNRPRRQQKSRDRMAWRDREVLRRDKSQSSLLDGTSEASRIISRGDRRIVRYGFLVFFALDMRATRRWVGRKLNDHWPDGNVARHRRQRQICGGRSLVEEICHRRDIPSGRALLSMSTCGWR